MRRETYWEKALEQTNICINEKSLYPLETKVVTGEFYDKNDFKNRYPDGRMGSVPYLAKSEHGALLLEEAAKVLSKTLKEFDKEK